MQKINNNNNKTSILVFKCDSKEAEIILHKQISLNDEESFKLEKDRPYVTLYKPIEHFVLVQQMKLL